MPDRKISNQIIMSSFLSSPSSLYDSPNSSPSSNCSSSSNSSSGTSGIDSIIDEVKYEEEEYGAGHNSDNYSNPMTPPNHSTVSASAAINHTVTNQSKHNFPLHHWLDSIQLETLEEILKTDDYCNKGKLDIMDEDGMTLLHRSILANRFEIVQLLIHNGANTRLASRAGWSAIHLAAYVGNVDILGFLLKN